MANGSVSATPLRAVNARAKGAGLALDRARADFLSRSESLRTRRQAMGR